MSLRSSDIIRAISNSRTESFRIGEPSAAKAVQSEAFKKLGANEGLVMVAEPPAALDRYFAGEEMRWRRVIEDAGIKAE